MTTILRPLLVLGVIALCSTASVVEALTISVAKIDKGAVQVKGSKAAPLSLIAWDSAPVVQASKSGSFRFATAILPTACVGTLSDGAETISVVMQSCGPPGPQGEPGEKGDPGPPGIGAEPPRLCRRLDFDLCGAGGHLANSDGKKVHLDRFGERAQLISLWMKTNAGLYRV